VGDGEPASAQDASAWVEAMNNHVVSTSNYGIAIASGHNNHIYANRVVASGYLSNGQTIAAQNVGLYVWNAYHQSFFAANRADHNLVGWYRPLAKQRNDWWLPDCAPAQCTNNVALHGPTAPITLSDENAELAIWKRKLSGAHVLIGPDW
jgi:hypothetical protein